MLKSLRWDKMANSIKNFTKTPLKTNYLNYYVQETAVPLLSLSWLELYSSSFSTVIETQYPKKY